MRHLPHFLNLEFDRMYYWRWQLLINLILIKMVQLTLLPVVIELGMLCNPEIELIPHKHDLPHIDPHQRFFKPNPTYSSLSVQSRTRPSRWWDILHSERLVKMILRPSKCLAPFSIIENISGIQMMRIWKFFIVSLIININTLKKKWKILTNPLTSWRSQWFSSHSFFWNLL